jgi:hypothetical protein
MAEELLLDPFHPMYNRLQRFPPPPNVVTARRPAPVIPAPVVKAKEKPPQVDFIPARQDVAIRAYYIFLHRGGHHGFDLDDWLEAELQLFAEHNAALKTPGRILPKNN